MSHFASCCISPQDWEGVSCVPFVTPSKPCWGWILGCGGHFAYKWCFFSNGVKKDTCVAQKWRSCNYEHFEVNLLHRCKTAMCLEVVTVRLPLTRNNQDKRLDPGTLREMGGEREREKDWMKIFVSWGRFIQVKAFNCQEFSSERLQAHGTFWTWSFWSRKISANHSHKVVCVPMEKKRQLTVAVVSPSLGNVRVDELSLLPDVYSLL